MILSNFDKKGRIRFRNFYIKRKGKPLKGFLNFLLEGFKSFTQF